MPPRCGAASSSRRAKPALEVTRDPEAGEDARERRRLEQHEHELERRVAIGEVEARARCEIPASPPANAVKKKSGKTIDGISSDLLWKKLCSIRHATPCATASAS